MVDLGTDFGIEVHPDSFRRGFCLQWKNKISGQDIFGNQVSKDLNLQAGNPYPFRWRDYPWKCLVITWEVRNLQPARLSNPSIVGPRVDEFLVASFFPVQIPDFTTAFDNHAKWDRVFKDETQREQGAGNGAVIGCNWTQGRWPGKGVAIFQVQRPGRLNLPGELKAVTMAAWVSWTAVQASLAPGVFKTLQKGAIGCMWQIRTAS